MIFYVCQVYDSADILAASWATAQTVDYDNVIADISEIKIGLADGVVVPVSNVEMKVLRTASTAAVLSSLATAFGLKYKISVSIDGTLYPIGTFYHASELPVSDAQAYTLFLQDAISRIGSTDIAPTLAEICAVPTGGDRYGTSVPNPLYGPVEELAFIKGLELTPTRIGFGDDQWNLNEPIWRKRRVDWGPVVPPTTIQTNDWIHFISHCGFGNDTFGAVASRVEEVFTADGGAPIPSQSGIGVIGTGDLWVTTAVAVTKGTRTWYVQILSMRCEATVAADLGLQSGVVNDDGTAAGPVPLSQIVGKYTISGFADIWGFTNSPSAVEAGFSQISSFLGLIPMTARWDVLSENAPGSGSIHSDGATCIASLLPLCDTPIEVDSDSYLRAQALARQVAGEVSGSARAAVLELCEASGINVCASRDGKLQFVVPTNDTPIALDRFDDVRFHWRDTGGRGAAFCGVHLTNQKKTPTKSEANGGTTLLTSSAMYIAGIRNALFEIDCTLIPLAMQQDAASILSYVGADPNGNQLVSLKIPLRDAKTLKVGDNIRFTWTPYIGAAPEIVTASIESMTFTLESVELSCVFNSLDAAPYVLPGDRLQSIMPTLQFAYSGVVGDPDFNDGVVFWEYSGTHWRTNGAALSSDLGTLDVWIRFFDPINARIVHAPGVLGFDPTDGVIITRGPDTLEAATSLLQGLDKYDILAAQELPLFFAAANGSPSAIFSSVSFAPINNAPICNSIGLAPASLAGLVWTFVGDFTIETASALVGFYNGDAAAWCGVVDGVGFRLASVIAGGIFSPGKITVQFDMAPTWRRGAGGLTGLQFAPVSPIGTDTGALTEADGTGTPSGPRELG